ncbi:hypothetical protein K438DRAFT_1781182 [Mycena galopus ATCC 62051]|nr:hypothetical protein K438DRAFT_1781182 [Mycena galopus ATCC 62051]
MGRLLKLLLKQFEEVGKKIRCIICKEDDPTGIGKTLERKSITSHLESSQHIAQSIDPIESEFAPPNTRAEMYDEPRPPSPAPTWEKYAAAHLAAPAIPSYITCTATDQLIEPQRLQEQVECLLVQTKQEEEDEPLNDTINHLKDMGLILETEGDEIDAKTYFNNVSIDRDYALYPNKVVWQAERTMEGIQAIGIDADVCTGTPPVLYQGGRRGKYVLPLAWIIRGGVLCADCYNILPAPVNRVENRTRCAICASIEFPIQLH